VSEEEACGTNRIVTGVVGDDKREVRLTKDTDLAREAHHARVVCDQAIPLACVMVEGKQDLPVVDLCE
jgi:hypothetical protein